MGNYQACTLGCDLKTCPEHTTTDSVEKAIDPATMHKRVICVY